MTSWMRSTRTSGRRLVLSIHLQVGASIELGQRVEEHAGVRFGLEGVAQVVGQVVALRALGVEGHGDPMRRGRLPGSRAARPAPSTNSRGRSRVGSMTALTPMPFTVPATWCWGFGTPCLVRVERHGHHDSPTSTFRDDRVVATGDLHHGKCPRPWLGGDNCRSGTQHLRRDATRPPGAIPGGRDAGCKPRVEAQSHPHFRGW